MAGGPTRKLRIGILNYREALFNVFLKSFTSQGHEVEIFELEHKTWEECEGWLKSRTFDFYLTANFGGFHVWKPGPQLERYLTENKLPCVVWHWEKAFFSSGGYLKRRLHREKLGENFLFFVTDRPDVQLLTSFGIRTYHLPLAVDDALRNFKPLKEAVPRLSYDLCFAGTPFRLQGVHASDEASLRRGYVVNNILEFYSQANRLCGMTPPGVDQNSAFLTELSSFYSIQYPNYQAFESAFDLLEPKIEPLLPPRAFEFFKDYRFRIAYVYSYYQLCIYLRRLRKFDIRIYGSEAWKDYIPDYPHSVPRLTDDEFYTMLSATKITFCLTKLQFHTFLHERSMMTLACGGFPLTDFREEISEMFEKDELISYKSYEEAEDLISYYLKHDEERRKISEKGQKRVLSSHTYEHRVRKLVQLTSEHFGFGA